MYGMQTVRSGPDPALGLCLLYDFATLLVGDISNKLWHHTFLWSILAVSMSLLINLILSQSGNFSWLKGFDSSFTRLRSNYVRERYRERCWHPRTSSNRLLHSSLFILLLHDVASLPRPLALVRVRLVSFMSFTLHSYHQLIYACIYTMPITQYNIMPINKCCDSVQQYVSLSIRVFMTYGLPYICPLFSTKR